MEEKKNTPVPPGKPEEKKSAAASEKQQKQKLKNKMVMYIAYTVGAIIVVIILMKFFGKPSDRLEGGANTELPDPAADRQTLDNKQDTYDLDPSGGSSYDNRGFEDIFATAFSKDDLSDVDVPEQAPYDPYAEFDASLSATQQSLDDFSKTLYRQRQEIMEDTTPQPSQREQELEAEVESLKMRQRAKEQADAAVASIMEESRRLAGEITDQKESDHSRKVEEYKNQQEIARTNVSPLADAGEDNVVSSLTEHRCASFYGMGGAVVNKNTIAASVYGKQVIMSGQQVRLRLEEPMVVGTQVLLPGSILTGTGTVGVDRLYISITSIEYNQVLTPVSLEAYDLDGQRGIFVPGSLEQEALRELGRDLASSLASTSEQSVSSFVNNQSAAERLKTDLARGAIQGVSRFAERKLDQLRITIQADHKLLLYPSNH